MSNDPIEDLLKGFSGKQRENLDAILGKAGMKIDKNECDEWIKRKYPGLFVTWPVYDKK